MHWWGGQRSSDRGALFCFSLPVAVVKKGDIKHMKIKQNQKKKRTNKKTYKKHNGSERKKK